MSEKPQEQQQLQQIKTNLLEDGSITKEILKEGVGNYPDNDQEVFFYYIMRHDDGKFIAGTESQPYKAIIGHNTVINQLELALKQMKIGERCLIKIAKAPEITTEGGIQIEIEVIRFGGLHRNRWELDSEKREKEAEQLKQQGNEFIKQKDYEQAKQKYEEAYRVIKNDNFDELKQSLLNNLSLVYLKLQDYQQAVDRATKALVNQQNNVKLYFRRGQAYCALENFESAISDIKKALELEPNNQELIKELEDIKAAEKKGKDKQKAVYNKMFQ